MEETTVPKKKKSAPKIPSIDTEQSGEKKRKAPKIPSIDQLEPANDPETPATADQEVPVKSKKKRAPKIEINDDPIQIEEPVKKKKSKAPKVPSIDDDFQLVEVPTIEELAETPIESKPKIKKSKKIKKATSQSFEDIEVNNSPDIENYTEPLDDLPAAENDSSEYERAITDAFSNLASQINFGDYVGNDQWCIIHLPKTARTEGKSRLRKMLPGGSKEEKPGAKPSVPKGSLLSRLRNGVNMLVRDENNLIFGERTSYDMLDGEEADGVDTDDLHRYAQKLRELEDQDKEVNPEFLVLRDGKTVYGVHESDADGKVKLSTRKPIYDRQADQKPDEQSEKRKLLARLKLPFSRNKDKDSKDSKSANATPDPDKHRKSSRKSLSNDLTTATVDDEPLQI